MKRGSRYRYGMGLGIAATVFLFWLIGAVGLIGAEGNPADRMYLGVLAVGILGSVVTRFRSRGMVRVLQAMAITQALVALIALLTGEQHADVTSVAEIVGVNGIFVVLFLVSAGLFGQAAREEHGAGGGGG